MSDFPPSRQPKGPQLLEYRIPEKVTFGELCSAMLGVVLGMMTAVVLIILAGQVLFFRMQQEQTLIANGVFLAIPSAIGVASVAGYRHCQRGSFFLRSLLLGAAVIAIGFVLLMFAGLFFLPTM